MRIFMPHANKMLNAEKIKAVLSWKASCLKKDNELAYLSLTEKDTKE